MNSMKPFPYRRICVVGSTGSGKSTLSSEIARRLKIPYVELDSLQEDPDGTLCKEEEMRKRVNKAIRGDAWVVDGNYSFLRDLTWSRAEVVVWLDYPMRLILWRLWKRAWKRVLPKATLWWTNKKRLRLHSFRKPAFLNALLTYKRRKRNLPAIVSAPEHATLKVYQFKSPRETEAWLYSWA